MLKEIIDHDLNPLLKLHGFKKNGLTWIKSSDGLYQIINIQKSRFNMKDDESFTINLGIFNPKIWKICWDRDAPKIIHEEDCFPRVRIGELVNSINTKNKDHWWNCTFDTDNSVLAKELVNLISQKCLPFLDTMLNQKNVIEYFKNKTKNMDPIEKVYLAILNMEVGDQVAAKTLLNEVSAISNLWALKANHVLSQSS